MTDEEVRLYFERVRWVDGISVCPHCAVVGESTRIAKHKATSRARAGLWQCRACRSQFSVTTGTVAHGSHLPLRTWLMAWFILASSKKSVSALQLQRQLGIGSYRSAWHLCHRVRRAMSNCRDRNPFAGDIEADECYVGGEPRRQQGHRRSGSKRGRGTNKAAVAVLVERRGRATARVVPNIRAETLRAFIRQNVDTSTSRLLTDELKSYNLAGRDFAHGHETTMHSIRQYAKPGGVHSNGAESYFSLLKRGLAGSWHHVSRKHLQRYCDEFSFRWSHRDVTDEQRMRAAIAQGEGVRLMYHEPREPNGHAALVARD